MKRIAIVGGGMGGLTAAHALTRPELKGKYEVTIFQMGWRLGGKCSTGRGENGRIEEHGIHAFLGAYYNALCLMEDVYGEWKPGKGYPLATFKDAFIKKNTGLHWERDGGELKRWDKWSPQVPITLDQVKKQKDFLIILWLKVYAKILQSKIADVPFGDQPVLLPIEKSLEKALVYLSSFSEKIEEFLAQGKLYDINKHLNDIEKRLKQFWESVKSFIDLEIKHSTNNPDDLRRNLLEVEMFQVILRGIRDDGLLFRGFKYVDDSNFDEWFLKHGASANLMESPLITYVPNLTFQFPNGDIAVPPEMSAASYLQWALRSALYIDQPLHLFAAGTGETLITPLYEVLKERGVKFEFFRELVEVIASKDGSRVEKLIFKKQADVLDDNDYIPLETIKGLRCWQNKPDYAQLVRKPGIEDSDFERPGDAHFGEGDDLEFDIDKVGHFEKVILAIPPRAISESAKDLLSKNKSWGNRVPKMPTSATQASQLWFKKTVEHLAAMPTKVVNNEVQKYYFATANFPGEMHGQLDFSKYIQYEDWPANEEPEGVVYGCGVMVDPTPEDRGKFTPRKISNLRAKESTRAMLMVMGADLLPNSVNQREETTNPHALDFNDLHILESDGGDNVLGQSRLNKQYFRGNVYPSDRYTQSPRNTKAHRINPLKPEIENMTGAGDWVDTVLNVGSVECTVMGGLLAAAFIHKKEDAKDVIGAWVTPADSLF